MNRKRIFCLILLLILSSLDASLTARLERGRGMFTEKAQLLNEEEAIEKLRAFSLPQDDYKKIIKRTDGAQETAEALSAYLLCGSAEASALKKQQRLEEQQAREMYGLFVETVTKLFADAVYFPVPEASDDQAASVSYENSWQYERNYGGVSGHEGTDIMADIQRRGYYPVISCSDGVVEKIGWLPKGGWRIGIRSPHGVYYYYAHLAEYEESMREGSKIAAGQLIGYMGDTGYSEVEGTTGNFPVHLHFGMYLNREDGEEVSYNPYYVLKILEANKLRYAYGK